VLAIQNVRAAISQIAQTTLRKAWRLSPAPPRRSGHPAPHVPMLSW